MKQILLLCLCCIPLMSLSDCRKKDSHSAKVPAGNQPVDTLAVGDCIRCIVLTDQAVPAIDIVDAGRSGKLIWFWEPSRSNIASGDVKWFSNPDDAKPVYNNKYLLINASGGGVALVRIADGKAVFYAYAGKNPHSSELLPDGNIVTASSTDNRLVVFHVDTTQGPDQVYKKVFDLPFAHNVVWDKKRQVLWAAGQNHLYEYTYNFNCKKPDLIPKDTFQLPGSEAHDLFPVYGKDSLWFTNPKGVYYIDMKTMDLSLAKFKYTENIKSVSSGPTGWPTIIMKPKVSWWSDEVMDSQGNKIFSRPGMKIYKARWLLPNLFSYPEEGKMKVCGL
ncbi:MAG TPA: DUF6528 family protein [Chitinophagaceae bacterium]|nr:DUF6528 family protein [Chitinophagaceae bacterium]